MSSRLNEALLDLISSERYVQYYVWENLTQRWPQLNWKTKIERVDRSPVILPDISALPVWSEPEMVYVPILGWQKLKQYLFPNRYVIEKLDNPEYRWQWTVDLWKSLFKSPTYLFWRVAGRIWMKPEWEHRGMEGSIAPPAAYARMGNVEEVHLEHFSWSFQYGMRYDGSNLDGDIWCAYHPGGDIFFIRPMRH